MTLSSESKPTMRTVLAIPSFRRLWIGQAISQFGDGLTSLALLITINQLTGSTAAMAGMAVVMAVPQLIFGLVSGVFVDRWDRKRTMIVSDLLRGLLVLGLILVQRPEDVWIFYLLGFLQALVGTFFNPARGALVPTLVGRDALLAANALAQTTQVVTSVVGSTAAGVLVGAARAAWPAFALDGLSFFISAAFIFSISAPRQTGAASGGVRETLAQLSEGLQYLLSQRMLVGSLVTFAVTMLGLGAVNVLIVPLLINLLAVPTEMLGIIEAAQVVGMVIGSLFVGILAARVKLHQIITAGIGLVGLFVALLGAAQVTLTALLAMLLIGLSITPVQAAVSTIMQQFVPNEKRGRVGAAMNTGITLASVISMACAGVLGDAIGIRQVFYLAGGISIFAGLLAALLMRPPATVPAPAGAD